MIHGTAIIDPSASLAEDVHIGPYCVIGAQVEIGAGTRVDSHVVINGPTRIGRNNRIAQFNSIGDDPQDKKFNNQPTVLEIGDNNVIREFCTFNRGTNGGGGVTRIGDDNWIMAYVHVAHDCVVGNQITMANGSTLAGHVQVDDFVTLGAFTIVHQFCAVGAHAFSAMGTVVFKDVPPYLMIAGNPAKPHGLNSEGLKRRRFEREVTLELKRAYKSLYRHALSLEHALAVLDAQDCEQVGEMAAFVRASTRGIVR
ncbi:MAG: UDP-N-acetylglucosamine acyltransferase [Gammaproteobacteria bacterium]